MSRGGGGLRPPFFIPAFPGSFNCLPFLGQKTNVRGMGGFFMTKYGRAAREARRPLRSEVRGGCAVARRLGVPLAAVRKWHLTYRSTGRKEPLGTSARHASCEYETKAVAARSVVDGGMARPEAIERFGVAGRSSLDAWCRLYREGCAEALSPGPRVGRGTRARRPPRRRARRSSSARLAGSRRRWRT